MKCTKCENEVDFDWPDDEQSRKVLQKYYYGPLCRECSGGSYIDDFCRQLEEAGNAHILPTAMWRKPQEELSKYFAATNE